jgi:hypothetical protein
MILCRSMVTHPNFIKLAIMICWFVYIISVYRQLAQAISKLELIKIIEMSRLGL